MDDVSTQGRRRPLAAEASAAGRSGKPAKSKTKGKRSKPSRDKNSPLTPGDGGLDSAPPPPPPTTPTSRDAATSNIVDDVTSRLATPPVCTVYNMSTPLPGQYHNHDEGDSVNVSGNEVVLDQTPLFPSPPSTTTSAKAPGEQLASLGTEQTEQLASSKEGIESGDQRAGRSDRSTARSRSSSAHRFSSLFRRKNRSKSEADLRSDGKKREAKSERRDAKSEQREAKSEQRDAKSEQREAKSEQREVNGEQAANNPTTDSELKDDSDKRSTRGRPVSDVIESGQTFGSSSGIRSKSPHQEYSFRNAPRARLLNMTVRDAHRERSQRRAGSLPRHTQAGQSESPHTPHTDGGRSSRYQTPPVSSTGDLNRSSTSEGQAGRLAGVLPRHLALDDHRSSSLPRPNRGNRKYASDTSPTSPLGKSPSFPEVSPYMRAQADTTRDSFSPLGHVTSGEEEDHVVWQDAEDARTLVDEKKGEEEGVAVGAVGEGGANVADSRAKRKASLSQFLELRHTPSGGSSWSRERKASQSSDSGVTSRDASPRPWRENSSTRDATSDSGASVPGDTTRHVTRDATSRPGSNVTAGDATTSRVKLNVAQDATSEVAQPQERLSQGGAGSGVGSWVTQRSTDSHQGWSRDRPAAPRLSLNGADLGDDQVSGLTTPLRPMSGLGEQNLSSSGPGFSAMTSSFPSSDQSESLSSSTAVSSMTSSFPSSDQGYVDGDSLLSADDDNDDDDDDDDNSAFSTPPEEPDYEDGDKPGRPEGGLNPGLLDKLLREPQAWAKRGNKWRDGDVIHAPGPPVSEVSGELRQRYVPRAVRRSKSDVERKTAAPPPPRVLNRNISELGGPAPAGMSGMSGVEDDRLSATSTTTLTSPDLGAPACERVEQKAVPVMGTVAQQKYRRTFSPLRTRKFPPPGPAGQLSPLPPGLDSVISLSTDIPAETSPASRPVPALMHVTSGDSPALPSPYEHLPQPSVKGEPPGTLTPQISAVDSNSKPSAPLEKKVLIHGVEASPGCEVRYPGGRTTTDFLQGQSTAAGTTQDSLSLTKGEKSGGDERGITGELSPAHLTGDGRRDGGTHAAHPDLDPDPDLSEVDKVKAATVDRECQTCTWLLDAYYKEHHKSTKRKRGFNIFSRRKSRRKNVDDNDVPGVAATVVVVEGGSTGERAVPDPSPTESSRDPEEAGVTWPATCADLITSASPENVVEDEQEQQQQQQQQQPEAKAWSEEQILEAMSQPPSRSSPFKKSERKSKNKRRRGKEAATKSPKSILKHTSSSPSSPRAPRGKSLSTSDVTAIDPTNEVTGHERSADDDGSRLEAADGDRVTTAGPSTEASGGPGVQRSQSEPGEVVKPKRLSFTAIILLKNRISRFREKKKEKRKGAELGEEVLEAEIPSDTLISIENELNLSKLEVSKETDILDEDFFQPEFSLDYNKKSIRFEPLPPSEPMQSEEPLPPLTPSTTRRLRHRRESTLRERRRKCIAYCKKFVAFLFSHIGLCSLVVAYTIMGGFIFRALEEGAESSVRGAVTIRREQIVGQLVSLAVGFQQTERGMENMTGEMNQTLLDYQAFVHEATK
ncbi:uncharacterized protein LOC118479107, partial [Aplysia californica]|uniref:Uncharacterized protein LOC118479107 n=1 Tax=Aplysia californica TaxID=6500 RepID=A0ABM1W4N8_APLCA